MSETAIELQEETTTEQGFILHLQRLSTEDGPGLRTTVFFKGCPLHCAWCHNPESISPQRQIQWLEPHCIGCRTCIEVCPKGCLALTESGHNIDREVCDVCGVCADACPAAALELLGKPIDLQTLLKEVIKDRVYFEKSTDGGVTLSGGEPLMQPAFATAFLRILKEEGVHTALDTCGLVARHHLENALAYTDVILFDLKEMDSAKHLAFTGQRNTRILDNLGLIAQHMRNCPTPPRLWIRTPLIPGATATQENIAAIGGHIALHLGELVERWDLLAFNNLAKDKFIRLGMDWPYHETPLLSEKELETFGQLARESGVNADIVQISGVTRQE